MRSTTANAFFYLEEVEEIRQANDRVYAGRRLHQQDMAEGAEIVTDEVESERWGIRGKADGARYRNGSLVAYEHKKGRSNRCQAWPSDRLQVSAYCALLEEATGKPMAEGRIRYHADNVTVSVAFDEAARAELRTAVIRAAELRQTTARPPITEDSRLCRYGSLAPVCLPEEERLALDVAQEAPLEVEPETQPSANGRAPLRLFPERDERRVLHITEPGSRVERAAEQLVVHAPDRPAIQFPGRDVATVVIHGSAQITTQALHYGAANGIAVQWLTGGGQVVGALSAGTPGVQRRHRQYAALSDPSFRLDLARRLAMAKVENQLRYLLRATRPSSGLETRDEQLASDLTRLRHALSQLSRVTTADELRGYEGQAGRADFNALPRLVQVEAFAFTGRSRRPPRDRFNALLSFFYALIYKDCLAALLAVGLEPAFGFLHTPRSAAHPLALDLMELFRVLLGDVPVIGSVNRRQWDAEADFVITPHKAWLSQEGKRKALAIYEERKQETWKHPVLRYSLSYHRTIELEARLLEKEWTGRPGLFARMRLR
ncbi:MAG: type I-MYXAN CRISPR-associated endonuclease Cas1 [Acidobacteriota bacterium]|nr:type I-MYXAN CRISPR-associated endonuclease Cas1 [Acidobacteriota bacterium]